MATVVERHIREVMLAKIPSRGTPNSVKALVKQVKQCPDEFWKSLTWGRNVEIADHERLRWPPTSWCTSCDPSLGACSIGSQSDPTEAQRAASQDARNIRNLV
jgi:IS30 family transposase